jgi:gliding motility-associated-like protein
MGKWYLKKMLFSIFFLLISQYSVEVFAQKNGSTSMCDSNVPYFNVDLSGSPDSVWMSPWHSREGYCCGSSGNTVCTSFGLKLDEAVTSITIEILGAVPQGALYYQVDCGPEIKVGEDICIQGGGNHLITFCKPGNNSNQFVIRSMSKPDVPKELNVYGTCKKQIKTYGFNESTVTWNSIFPGEIGDYNNYLSCVNNCTKPLFTPDGEAPDYIDYVVCGSAKCGNFMYECDTVRVFVNRYSLTMSATPASCFGASSGIASVTVIGLGDFNYLWSSGENTAEIVNKASGLYKVQVTVEAGCIITDSIFIPEPDPLQVDINKEDVRTPDGDYGSASAQVSGGSPEYTFLWNTGETTPTIENLTAGTYSVTVTDQNGCATTAEFIIEVLPCNELDIDLTVMSVSCKGSGDGSAAINSFSGVSPYVITWSNGLNGNSISGLIPGQYSVNIMGADHCGATKYFTILEPEVLNLSFQKTDVFCFGGDNGSASITIDGGTAPYSVKWSNEVLDVINENLSAGTYEVSVTDANNCQASASIKIDQPSQALSAIVVDQENVVCKGADSGSATVQASGGSGNYSYYWNHSGEESATAINLSAGVYEVIISDKNGCAASINLIVDILQPESSISAAVTNIQNTSCNDGDNGSATVTVIGGSGEYAYEWNTNPIQNEATANGLTAGSYTVTITDLNGCNEIVTANVTIGQPEPLNATAKVSSAKCGENNGSALLEVTGGTQPYYFEWSNGNNENSSKDMATGTYTVLVKDNNMCEKLLVVEVDSITPMTVNANVEDLACHQEDSGVIELFIEGGLAPYTYSWNTRNRNSKLKNVKAGTYTVTINDASGCSVTQEYLVKEPEAMKINFQLSVFSNNHNISETGKKDGEILVNITGGTLPYSFLWSNGSNSAEMNELPAGIYQLTVTDANGCELNQTIELTEPASIQIPNGFSPNGNGKNDWFVIKGLEDYPDNSLVVFNRWGNEVFSRDNYSNDWTGINNQGKELPQGTYFIILKVIQNGEEEVYKTYVELRK